MSRGRLTIATCQFPVCNSISRNLRWISRAIRQAADMGAEVVHLPEASLTGYPGTDLPDLRSMDWDRLRECTRQVMALAADKAVWVILGSAHRLAHGRRPHNSLYIIGPDGRLRGRYDKRFCMESELRHYSPGSHFEVFTVNGVRCSALICFDLRFPELYRQLYRFRVRCVFQSCYNARQAGPSVHNHIMIPTMQANAACNAMWVSVSNSSGYYSPYAACIIRPDGVVAARLHRHRAGVLVHTLDLDMRFYDPMNRYRRLATKGRLSNGPRSIPDPRSVDTHSL